MMWSVKQRNNLYQTHDVAVRICAFGRRAGLRGCRRLQMLPDSFSHLHYLHHVFHHHAASG
jgi:hypothetical protein